MKLIAAYHKGQEIAMISHLDIQRTLQRALRRANLPLLYSNGFNPHPQFSFATAAATGMSSCCEWFEVQLSEEIDPSEFMQRANAVMPQGMSISGAFTAPEQFGSLSAKLRAAEYRVRFQLEAPVLSLNLQCKCNKVTQRDESNKIVFARTTMKGFKPNESLPSY